MSKKCLNCNAAIAGEYCSRCGQSANTHKINLHYLWHDIQHGLFHVDKGILFTTKELFTRPGNTIREFLQGKRVNHFKPISLVVILAGLYSLLSHYFGINMLANYYELKGSGVGFDKIKAAVDNVSEWVSQHYAVMTLMQIPAFSVGTYIFFKKAGYNFIEHLVINSFIAGQKLILHIVTFPIYYWFNKTTVSRPVDQTIAVIGYALAFWTIFQLFNQINYFNRFWRTFFSFLISFVTFIIFLFLIFSVIIYWLK
jgi:hypothetical protein